MNRSSIILTIFVVAIIFIVGGTFYFSHENKVPAAPAPSVSSASGPTTLITIPELGIEFKASSEIKDLTYSVKSLGDFGNAAYFSTESLSALEPNCSSTYNSIGAIAVLNQKQWEDAQGGLDQTGTTTPAFDPKNPNTPVHLGDDYIIYDEAGGLCASNAATVELQRAQAEALVQSLGSLQTSSLLKDSK